MNKVTTAIKTKFGGFDVSRLGNMFTKRETILDESKLSQDIELGNLLLKFTSSVFYKEGLKVVLHKRREEILSDIKTGKSDKFERLSGRLQEIDSIEETIMGLIKKGDDANRKLTESKE